MSHTFHAEIHEFGLADGCPDCEEAGLNPLAFLDEEILRDLVARVAAETPPRSNAERSALAEIRGALNRFGRLAKLNPEPALGFLAGWGVHVTLAPAPPAAAPENAPELVGTPEQVYVVFSLGEGDPTPITTCLTAELAAEYAAALADLPLNHLMFTADPRVSPIPLLTELPPGLREVQS